MKLRTIQDYQDWFSNRGYHLKLTLAQNKNYGYWEVEACIWSKETFIRDFKLVATKQVLKVAKMAQKWAEKYLKNLEVK